MNRSDVTDLIIEAKVIRGITWAQVPNASAAARNGQPRRAWARWHSTPPARAR